jgi:Glu-tRNA(Gln) amidotransferase subunit E-like FAD-binding protein
MSINYEALGLKCGLEVHQQIDSHKLFCNCPSVTRDDQPDIVIKRRLRAAAGETGEIDVAAAHEAAKQKYFIYQAYSDTTCLVELDSEPPHNLNEEALQVALQVALMLKAKVVDAVQVMRKTVVDGSNTSGFQRTALVARNGFLETSKGKVTIPIICLEEEAAKIVERTPSHDVYNLSRLGIPLLEIGTGPEIKSPEHAREVAEKLGMILRSTGRVKRGIGTIRQDLNISIREGARVEVKGAQDLKQIAKLVEKEVLRQKNLIEAKKKVPEEVRRANPDSTTSFLRPMPGAARMYPETDVAIVKPDTKGIVLPELRIDAANRLIRLGLGTDLANKIVKQDLTDLFEEFAKQFQNVKAAFIAETLVSYVPELLREKAALDPFKIKEDHLRQVFKALNEQKIAKQSVMEILREVAAGKELSIEKYRMISDSELEKRLKNIISENKNLPFNALVGKAMARLRNKADGKKIVEMLKKLS